MCVAKTDQAHWKLSRQFAERTTQKTYLAVVQGVPELDSDCINQPLGVHPSNRTKYSIRPDGKESSTVYQVLEKFRGYSLVQVSPRTGRTHQIREHLADMGHPVLGDKQFGTGRKVGARIMPVGRQMLHAYELVCPHPTKGSVVRARAPLPADFRKCLRRLQLS